MHTVNKDALICSLCQSIYRNPCALACMHVFCENCLTHLRQYQANQCRYICSICGMRSFSAQVKPSRIVQELVDRIKLKPLLCIVCRRPMTNNALPSVCSVCTKKIGLFRHDCERFLVDVNRAQLYLQNYRDRLIKVQNDDISMRCQQLDECFARVHHELTRIRTDIQTSIDDNINTTTNMLRTISDMIHAWDQLRIDCKSTFTQYITDVNENTINTLTSFRDLYNHLQMIRDREQQNLCRVTSLYVDIDRLRSLFELRSTDYFPIQESNKTTRHV